MNKLLISLAGWALRRVLGSSAQLWTDLKGRVRMADRAVGIGGRPLTNDERHADVDQWLATVPGFATLTETRKRLVQAAVITVRLEQFWADFPF